MTGIAGYAKIAYNHVADNKWKYAAGAAGLAFVGFAAYTGRPQIACNLAKAAFSKLGQGLSYVNKNAVSPALTYAAQNKAFVGVSALFTLALLHQNRKVSAARKETAECSDELSAQKASLASQVENLQKSIDALTPLTETVGELRKNIGELAKQAKNLVTKTDWNQTISGLQEQLGKMQQEISALKNNQPSAV